MQLVDLTPPMAVSLECEPGRYLLTDANASELKAPNPDPYQNEHPDWSNPPKRILIIPPMGIGDLIFLTPSLFAIRQQYPETEIAVCGFAASLVVLEHAVEGVKLLPYPVPHSALEQFDCIASLESVVEAMSAAPAVDTIANALGVSLEDPKPRYIVTQEERDAAVKRFPRKSPKRVGIQARASSNARTWPWQHLISLMALMLNDGWEVVLFGVRDTLPPVVKHPRLIDTSRVDPELGIREVAALVEQCDVIIAPDSSICHIAGSLDVPTVALYGPFPWNIRTAVFPTVRSIQGNARCAPCFHHSTPGKHWPDHCPAKQTGVCVAMENILPVRVFREAEKRARAPHY